MAIMNSESTSGTNSEILADQTAGLFRKRQNVSENPGKLKLPLRSALGAMMYRRDSRSWEWDSRIWCPVCWPGRSSPVGEGRKTGFRPRGNSRNAERGKTQPRG